MGIPLLTEDRIGRWLIDHAVTLNITPEKIERIGADTRKIIQFELDEDRR